MENEENYCDEPGFCPDCGSILPLLEESGTVKCYTCKRECSAEVFKNLESYYVIPFNSYDKQSKKIMQVVNEEGPTVERKCPRCNNDKMSYATLQLRSADEGQTVFYTCTNCKFKETENS
ncbi:DNA-directed RNA polymerase I subunit RPA12 [Halyomorpha halys]|uniref:DNA-directed RNA polymerase I subunit RPA12 n=1 Tax=Halyomorpha halys TaxID=286706 RepID=UPI0006D4DFF3|nr:DNA-directed RNA polymerase I subunit RPA12 [Halyomorpha halys]